jgi:acetyl esterase/lipase
MPLKPNIYKSKILVLHGADDPIVPDDQTIAFWNEMREAKANWKFVAYGGAPHLYKLADAGTVRHPPFTTNRLAAAVLPCRISSALVLRRLRDRLRQWRAGAGRLRAGLSAIDRLIGRRYRLNDHAGQLHLARPGNRSR